MAKKLKPAKKLQLRHCGFCQKVGHNKSTCPDALSFNLDKQVSPNMVSQTNTGQTERAPLKFFVHHVQYQNHESPHLVNLKKEKNKLLEHIQAVAPEENNDFYFFHERHTAAQSAAKPVAAPSFLPKIMEAQKEPTQQKNTQRHAELVSASRSRNKFGMTIKKLSQKLSDLKFSHAQKAKSAIHKIRATAAPKHFVGATLAILFLIFVPSGARTYYFDLKSTTNKIADSSTAGFTALHDSTSALMSGNLTDAQLSLTDALQNFEQAVNILDSKYSFLQKIISAVPIVNNEVQSRQRLIVAGQEISLGNTYLLKGLSEIQQSNSTITKNLALVGDHLKFSLPHYQTAVRELNNVDSDVLPFEYQDTFKEFRVLFNVYVKDLETIAQLNNAVQEIFGGKGLRRYLLIFQNPAELRPTGGFMGSFAMLDIKDGEIIHIDIPAGGSYDLQGQLTEYIVPPTPLLLSNKRWEFQDANWFPDFPASAEKALWFYRHSRGVTADGVIAINASVLNRLLSIMGPVADENRGLVLDKTNALATIQDIVEYGPEKKDNKPKQILSDLAPVFIENFKNITPKAVLPMLTNLEEGLQQKEIQTYFTDENTQKTIREFGWSGEIIQTNPNQDYLLVVNTNIQGQKSDAKIKQNISHQAVIQPDGTIVNSVVITREHTGNSQEKLYGQTNIDYLRIYVPEGSELVRASGFTWPEERIFRAPESWYEKDQTLAALEKEESTDSLSGTRITKEFGKTAFGNWIITEPGQTTEVQFIYKLPFKAWEKQGDSNLNNWAKIFQSQEPISNYQLVAQKQSGINSNFESQVIFPDGWLPIWHDGLGLSAAANGMSIKLTELGSDKIWSLVMKKNDN
ncbi:MAG: DUF4012 domain-containing protein [Candidatus Magasanikbacteria bacterium]|nr:DUF4012 domain-containing protein [Candidatus Magasanikbacteria bacterium]